MTDTPTAAGPVTALAEVRQKLLAAVSTLEQPGNDPAHVASAIRDIAHAIPAYSLPPLTPRRLEVLTLVAGGLTNKEIAKVAGVTPARVKQIVSDLLAITRLSSRSSLAAWAASHGLPITRLMRTR